MKNSLFAVASEVVRRQASRVANGIVRLSRLVRSNVRKAIIRVCFPRVSFAPGVVIGARVRISAIGECSLTIGDGATIDAGAVLIARDSHISIGASTYIGIGAVIVGRSGISIGANTLLAEYVTVRDQDHSFGAASLVADSGFVTAPVSIGANVWIGAKATITRGVTIGDNAVIGANAVVTHDIPRGALAVGVPARVVRQLYDS